MKSYDEFFNAESKKAGEWEKKFLELWSTNDSDAVKKFLKDTNAKKIYRKDYLIQYLIDSYTRSDSANDFLEVKELLLRAYKNDIKEIYIKKNEKFNLEELNILTTDGLVTVIKLSSLIPYVREYFKSTENIDIETLDRRGKCIIGAYYIANNLGIPNDLVTGYIYGSGEKARYLHSWVETKLHDEDYVIDLTMNGIINKDAFYKIKHINKLEEIQRISSETIINDMKRHGDIMDAIGMTIEEYALLRDEFINDFERVKSNLKR